MLIQEFIPEILIGVIILSIYFLASSTSHAQEEQTDEIRNGVKYPHHNDEYCVEYRGIRVIAIYDSITNCAETLDFYLDNGYKLITTTERDLWLIMDNGTERVFDK